VPGFQGISSPGTLAPGLVPALESHLSCKQANRLILWGVGGAPPKKKSRFFLFFFSPKKLEKYD
jgi:hypothetical protein